MPGAIFPTFAGQTPKVNKAMYWSTKRAEHVSGRVVRAAQWQVPKWKFALQFAALDSSGIASAVGSNTYNSLQGFYSVVQQAADTFWFSDPNAYRVTSQALGTGNGTNTVFNLTYNVGSFIDVVGQVNSATIAIYANGTLVSPSAYTVTGPNQITFTTAPSSGVVITGTYAFYYVCEFPDDYQDFEQLWFGMWKLDGLKFQSVKP